MDNENHHFSVALTSRVAATDPVHAAMTLIELIGRRGADLFVVTDESTGEQFHVDLGLLSRLGLLKTDAVEEVNEESKESPVISS